MPDIYGNIPSAPTSPSQESYVVTPDVNPNLPDITQPSDGTTPAQKVDWGEFASKQATQNALRKTNVWQSSQLFNTPLISTPVKETERYLSPSIGYDATDTELEQKYADQQGVIKRLGNRLAKTGATAVVSFLDTFNSAADFMAGKDSESGNTTTELNNWLTRLDQVYLPNYQTREQKENPIGSFFTPWHLTSWIDNIGNVTQNLGYTIGAIGSAVLVDTALGAATGGEADVVLLPKQLERIFASLGKFSRIVSSGGEEYTAFKQALGQSDDVVAGINAALSKAGNIKHWSDIGRFALGVSLSAYGESIMEGNKVFTQIKNDLENEYKDEYGNFRGTPEIKEKIRQTAAQAAKATVAPNFAFLAVSNAIGMGSVLRPASAAVRATEEALAKQAILNVKDINTIEAVATKGVGNKFLQRLVSPAHLLQDNVREAIEEGYQYVVSDSNTNFYEKQFSKRSNEETFTLAQSYANSVGRLFTTTEGKLNMLMGFLGGIFQHGAKHLISNARGITPLRGLAFAQDLAGQLNRYSATGLFNTARNEAVASSDIAYDMANAAKSGNIFAYKNLQLQGLFNFVSSGVKTNKFDLRLQQLEALKGFNQQQFETFWKMDFNDTNSKIVNDYVDGLITKSKEIADQVKKIDKGFGRNPFKRGTNDYLAFDFYKDELALSLTKQKDYRRRAGQLREQAFSVIPAANYTDILALSSEEGVKETISNFNKKIADLKNSEQLALSPGVNGEVSQDLANTFKEEREFLEEHVKDLEGNLKNWDEDLYIQSLKNLYNYYGNANSVKGEFDIDEADALGVYNNAQDVYKLIKATKRSADTYTKLARRNGFEDFKAEFISKLNDFSDNITINDDGTFQIKTATPEITPVETKPLIDSLGVTTKEEAKKEIDKDNKEIIARAVDPAYEKSAESLGSKIINGTQVITPELKDQAKAAIDSSFQEKAEAPTTDKNAQRENFVKQQMQELGVNPTPSDASMEEIYADQDKAIEEDLNPEVTTNSSEKFWSNMMSPIKLLNKLFGKNFKDVQYQENLRKILFDTPFLNLGAELFNKLRVEITENPGASNAESFDLIRGSKALYRRTPFDLHVNVYADQTPLGYMHPPNSLYFKRGDNYLPITDLLDAKEYAEVTKNNPVTFDAFKKSIKNYTEAYNKLTASYDGTVAKVDNQAFQRLFRPTIAYGGRANSNKEDESTVIKNLKYKGKGSAILSFPVLFNEKSGQWERTSKPNVLNASQLTDEELFDVLTFVDKNVKKFHDIGRRYFYLSKLPDGRFYDTSIIAARPSMEVEEGLANAFEIIQNAISNTDKKPLTEVNTTLKNSLYLSDRNDSKGRNGKVPGNQITLEVAKNGDLNINVFNTRKKARAQAIVKSEDVRGAKNFDDLSALISTAVKQQVASNYEMSQLRPIVDRGSFKKAILADENVSIDDIESKLKASVKPEVFQDFTLHFMPVTNPVEVVTPTPPEATTIPEAVPSSTGLTEALGGLGKDISDSLKPQIVKEVNNGSFWASTKEGASQALGYVGDKYEVIEKDKTVTPKNKPSYTVKGFGVQLKQTPVETTQATPKEQPVQKQETEQPVQVQPVPKVSTFEDTETWKQPVPETSVNNPRTTPDTMAARKAAYVEPTKKETVQEQLSRELAEAKQGNKFLQTIDEKDLDFYGRVGEIQQAYRDGKYDDALRSGEVTEEELRAIFKSAKLSDNLADIVIFRVTNQGLQYSTDQYAHMVPEMTSSGFQMVSNYFIDSGRLEEALKNDMIDPAVAKNLLDNTITQSKEIKDKKDALIKIAEEKIAAQPKEEQKSSPKATVYEKPELESPIYKVTIEGTDYFIQRSSGMNPSDTAWYQVVKRGNLWESPKGKAGVMADGHVGYTKEEAIQTLIANHSKPAEVVVEDTPRVAQEAVTPDLSKMSPTEFAENFKNKGETLEQWNERHAKVDGLSDNPISIKSPTSEKFGDYEVSRDPNDKDFVYTIKYKGEKIANVQAWQGGWVNSADKNVSIGNTYYQAVSSVVNQNETPVETEEEIQARIKAAADRIAALKAQLAETVPETRNFVRVSDDKGIRAEKIPASFSKEKVDEVVKLRDSLVKIAERIRKVLPDVPVDFVFADVKWKGRVHEGRIEINLNTASMDTPIHELLHPFVLALRLRNFELYSNLINELKFGENSGFIDEVHADADYMDLSDLEKDEEGLVRFLADDIKTYFNEDGTISDDKLNQRYSDTKNPFKRVYDWIRDIIAKIFDFKKESKVDTIATVQRVIYNKPKNIITGYKAKESRTFTVKLDDKEALDKRGITPEILSKIEGIVDGKEEAVSINVSELGIEKPKETKHINYADKNVSITVEDIPVDFNLQNLSDFIAAQTQASVNLSSEIEAINKLEAYQHADKIDMKEFLKKIKNKLEVLSDTAERRIIGADIVQGNLIGVRRILRDYDGVEAVTEYIQQGMRGINAAVWLIRDIGYTLQKAKEGFVERYDDKGKRAWVKANGEALSDELINELNRNLIEARTLIGFYDDVNKLFNIYREEFNDKEVAFFNSIIAQQDLKETAIHHVAAQLTTEWLFPTLEKAQENLAPQYQMTKKQFQDKLYVADKDISGISYWMGAAINARDPINAIVAVLVKDKLNQYHQEETDRNFELRKAWDVYRKEKGIGSSVQAAEDYYKANFLRKAKTYEIVAYDKEKGEPKYDYKERWAYHEKYFWDLYYDDLRLFKKQLEETDGKPSTDKQWDLYNAKVTQWMNANNPSEGNSIKYVNPKFDQLSKDAYFSLLYNTYKESNEKYGERRLDYGIIPQAYKKGNSLVEFAKNVKKLLAHLQSEFKGTTRSNLGDKLQGVGTEAANYLVDQDSYLREQDVNLDDSYYRGVKSPFTYLIDEANLDFRLNESTLAFMTAANTFSSLRTIQANVENLKAVIEGNPKLGIKARQIARTDKGKTIFDRFAHRPEKETAERLNKQLISFINDIFYGEQEFQSDVTLGDVNINLNTIGRRLGFLTALQTMAGNVFAGISNVTIGNIMSLGEAVGGKYYGKANWAKGLGIYSKNTMNYLADVTRPVKSKVTQLGVIYDAIQGEFRDRYGKNITGNIMNRYASSDTFFIINHAAEHQIQLTGMLALMDATKVKLKDGSTVTLFEAYEEDKRGFYKLRSDAIWSTEDDLKFTKKLHGISKDLNGNYASFDKSMLQRYWWGKLAIQYRKYLYPAWRSRFGGQRVDYERGEVLQGYYRTFLKKAWQDMKDYKFNLVKSTYNTIAGKTMSPEERYARNKTLYDITIMVATTMIGIALAGGEADDDLEKNAYLREANKKAMDRLLVTMLRLRSDVSQFSWTLPQEVYRTIMNPSASLNLIKNYADFMGQLVSDPTEQYKRSGTGYEQGDAKLGVKFEKLVPLYRQWLRWQDPADQVKYYTLINKDIQPDKEDK